jgi:hypothetical protein
MSSVYKTTIDSQIPEDIEEKLNQYLTSQSIHPSEIISVQYIFYEDKKDFVYHGVRHWTDIWITTR